MVERGIHFVGRGGGSSGVGLVVEEDGGGDVGLVHFAAETVALLVEVADAVPESGAAGVACGGVLFEFGGDAEFVGGVGFEEAHACAEGVVESRGIVGAADDVLAYGLAFVAVGL